MGRVIILDKTVLCGLGHVPVKEKAQSFHYVIFPAVNALTLEDRMWGSGRTSQYSVHVSM